MLDLLSEGEIGHGDLVAALARAGHDRANAEDLIRELRLVRAIQSEQALAAPQPSAPPADYPLQALVLNITNQCNLACTYCYEFGSDKIATPQGKLAQYYLGVEYSPKDILLGLIDASGNKIGSVTQARGGRSLADGADPPVIRGAIGLIAGSCIKDSIIGQ